jgi:hypothetical protein
MSNTERLPKELHPAPTKVLLPLVTRAIQQLDVLFIAHAGAAGSGLVKEVMKVWLAAGRTGPSALRHYVYALGTQLDDPAAKREFHEEAEQLLLQIRSGFAN